ncbi:hypothetical protein REPUB_Repub09cG0177100 [Reevesia pubescens]
MEVDSSFAISDFGSTQARSAFQWGGTIFALGQFGCWVAFFAVASNLFFPQTIPVSHFILFVITPDWVADRLRDDIVPGIMCLIIAILVVLTEIRGIGGLENCQYYKLALARSTEGREDQFALTRHIVETKGYMAPEYFENGLVSTKLDVKEYMNLADILSNVLQESLKHLVDPTLLENYPSELAIVVIKLINSCLKKDLTARPAMDEIVKSLSRILITSSAWDSSNNMSRSQTSTGSY